MKIPSTWRNPIKFEPHKLGSTGVKVLDALGQAAIMVGCGLAVGVCKVEGDVGNAWLVSTPDEEYIAGRITDQLMGLGMVDMGFPGMNRMEVGIAREAQVADLFGDDVIGRNVQVEIVGFRSGEVDIVVKDGLFIEVGGPGKLLDKSGFGNQMKFLKTLAEIEQGEAFFYYAEDTPQWVIEKAIEWLGEDHVVPIPSSVGQ